MNTYATVVLAAGKGTRMKSKKHKVLHPICGKPMIDHVLDELFKINPQQMILVTGYDSHSVREHVGDRVVYVEQREQLGAIYLPRLPQPQLQPSIRSFLSSARLPLRSNACFITGLRPPAQLPISEQEALGQG